MYIFGAETRIRSLSRRAQQRRVYINIGVTRRRDAMDFWNNSWSVFRICKKWPQDEDFYFKCDDWKKVKKVIKKIKVPFNKIKLLYLADIQRIAPRGGGIFLSFYVIFRWFLAIFFTFFSILLIISFVLLKNILILLSQTTIFERK